MAAKIKVMTKTQETRKDTWIKVNIQNRIQFWDSDQVQTACKKLHKMQQVDLVEL